MHIHSSECGIVGLVSRGVNEMNPWESNIHSKHEIRARILGHAEKSVWNFLGFLSFLSWFKA